MIVGRYRHAWRGHRIKLYMVVPNIYITACYTSLLSQEAIKRNIIFHHVQIGSRLAYLFLHHVSIGS